MTQNQNTYIGDLILKRINDENKLVYTFALTPTISQTQSEHGRTKGCFAFDLTFPPTPHDRLTTLHARLGQHVYKQCPSKPSKALSALQGAPPRPHCSNQLLFEAP